MESRILSAYKSERIAPSKILVGPAPSFSNNSTTSRAIINQLHDALYAAKICSYAQGFALLRLASQEYDYRLNYAEIARIWRAGCIIRAGFLDDIRQAFTRSPDLPNLMVDSKITAVLNTHQNSLRKIVAFAAESDSSIGV